MSSGSVFFVLDRLLQSGATGHMGLIAFGPGLTVDRVDLTALRANTKNVKAAENDAVEQIQGIPAGIVIG